MNDLSLDILSIRLDVNPEEIADGNLVIGYRISPHRTITIDYNDKEFNTSIVEVLQAVIDKINWIDK